MHGAGSRSIVGWVHEGSGTPLVANGPRGGGSLVCFVSYRRADADGNRVLQAFWEDLRHELIQRSGVEAEKLYFRDRESLSSGDVWDEEIATAIGTSRVFVAMYTPGYFKRLDKPCYCGKELQAFLLRCGDDRDLANIVPVLWTVPKAGSFGSENFPPDSLRWINGELAGRGIDSARRVYETEGLQRVRLRAGRPAYMIIVADIADRVLALAANPPPTVDDLPGFASVPCAFHGEDEEWPSFPEASPTEIVGGAGPKRVVLLYLTEGEVPDTSLVAAGIQRLVFGKGYHPQPLRWQLETGIGRLRDTLRATSEANQLPVLVVAATKASEPAFKATLQSLIDEASADGWMGGIAVAGHDAVSLTASDCVSVQVLGSNSDMVATQLTALLSDIRARMNRAAPVAQLPTGSGPLSVPHL
jgi:TIR domain